MVAHVFSTVYKDSAKLLSALLYLHTDAFLKNFKEFVS